MNMQTSTCVYNHSSPISPSETDDTQVHFYQATHPLFWVTALIFNVLWLLVAADVWAFRLPQTPLLSHYRGQSNNLTPLGWNTQTTSSQLHTQACKHTGRDTHVDAQRVVRSCTHPEGTHLPLTHAHTPPHTQFYLHIISIQFSASKALTFHFTSISNALWECLPWPLMVKLDIIKKTLQGMSLQPGSQF